MKLKMDFRLPVCSFFLILMCLSVINTNLLFADSWPSYRHDNSCSGRTEETIGPEHYLHYKYVPKHAPRPSWPMPAEELPRMHIDNAYHITADEKSIYFGSSVTNQVYSLDAACGRVNWTFYAEGPVRFAPTINNNCIYFGSDDGFVYCLNAANGRLIWKYRPGLSDEKVIGNGRMISLWPITTSVLIDNGQALFAAGVFPFEGIIVCALNAVDGTVVWRNDTVGDRAHDLEYGGLSPFGYPVASKDVLYIPSGRAMPAAFSRTDGSFLFYASPGGKQGGSWALLNDDDLIAGVEQSGSPTKVAYDAKTGKRKGNAFAWFPGIDIVITKERAYILTTKGLYAIDRNKYKTDTQKVNTIQDERSALSKNLTDLRKKLEKNMGQTADELKQQIDLTTKRIDELNNTEQKIKKDSYLWHYPKENLTSMIMTGDIIYVAAVDSVIGIDSKTANKIWQAPIKEKPASLAAANSRLFVSTEKGPIYCFGRQSVNEPQVITHPQVPDPYFDNNTGDFYSSIAKTIVSHTGIDKGYCLVLDCKTGQLAYELAKITDLQIVGIETDKNAVKIARQKLQDAGLLGKRIIIETWDISSLPDYFANLVVSEGMLTSLTGKSASPQGQIDRILRPCGGTAMLGTKKGLMDDSIKWTKFVRPQLTGSASWTQLYGNPQNTACSNDQLVKGPFGVLWYGQPGPEQMVERHARAVGPVSANGRLFVQGEECIMAYDAYNGTFLWKRNIPGAVRVRVDVDAGNLALTDNALYVAAHEKCYRLDPVNGKIVRTYEVPSSSETNPRRWGFISCVDNVLIGNAAMPLKKEYAAVWKDFVDPNTNDWIKKEQITDQTAKEWSDQRRGYNWVSERIEKNDIEPDQNLRMDFQRSGMFWHPITDFPSWGSQKNPQNTLTERLLCADEIFAMDADTGQLLWTYSAKQIPNISITIAQGKVFLVESGLSEPQKQVALFRKEQLIADGVYQQHPQTKVPPEDADIRAVTALDMHSGKVLWKAPLDVTGCGGDKMGTAFADGLLLLFGHFSNHDTGYFLNNELTWRRITTLSADDGHVVWSKPLNYLRRPLIVGDRVIIEPRACDLKTGDIITRPHPITGKPVPWELLRPGHCCSITSASADTLFYRSFFAAIYELSQDKGLNLFGAIRPGCWLNMISANGLMLMPEASSGCTCSFPLRSSVALVSKPNKASDNWTVFITHGDMTPARHFAVNFGASGDMKDSDGTVWFAYPRPRTISPIGYGSYGVKFELNEKIQPGKGYFNHDFRAAKIDNTDKDWLFASGCEGLIRCNLPLIDQSAGQKPGMYTVRLGFCAPVTDKTRKRVFDVELQGSIVLKKFDITKTANGTQQPVIKEFKDIEVKDFLTLKLYPDVEDLQVTESPLINFIEVIRQDQKDDADLASVF